MRAGIEEALAALAALTRDAASPPASPWWVLATRAEAGAVAVAAAAAAGEGAAGGAGGAPRVGGFQCVVRVLWSR